VAAEIGTHLTCRKAIAVVRKSAVAVGGTFVVVVVVVADRTVVAAFQEGAGVDCWSNLLEHRVPS